ncbi:MAG: hypothetical protein AAGE99_03810 [Chlamydiota bacterium]
MTAEDAAKTIRFGDENQETEGRSISTIQNKIASHNKKGPGLKAYQIHCWERNNAITAEPANNQTCLDPSSSSGFVGKVE